MLISCNGNRSNVTVNKEQTTTIRPETSIQHNLSQPITIKKEISRGDTTVPKKHLSTHLRFPNFTVIFHDFRGYQSPIDENGAIDLRLSDTTDYTFNLDERELDGVDNSAWQETLIARNKDSIGLSEDLDERINNTLIEIIPKSKRDSFAITACYLSALGQIIDSRKYQGRPSEEAKAMAHAIHYNEKSPSIFLKDSAKYFFRAFPHTSDMLSVTVKNNKVVPTDYSNTQEQQHAEAIYDSVEFKRIKTKYHLRDTLVELGDESDTYANFTHNKKLFLYQYDSFLFRIDRYRDGMLAETRYIVIGIQYGC